MGDGGGGRKFHATLLINQLLSIWACLYIHARALGPFNLDEAAGQPTGNAAAAFLLGALCGVVYAGKLLTLLHCIRYIARIPI